MTEENILEKITNTLLQVYDNVIGPISLLDYLPEFEPNEDGKMKLYERGTVKIERKIRADKELSDYFGGSDWRFEDNSGSIYLALVNMGVKRKKIINKFTTNMFRKMQKKVRVKEDKQYKEWRDETEKLHKTLGRKQ